MLGSVTSYLGAPLPASDPALDRLARFDGTGFQPVGPGTIDAAIVHVFAHGWQPGYRVQERLLATADGVSALPAWDPRLVDSTGRALIADYLALLQALAGLGPDHAVLWYSWLDESATEADVFQAHRSRQATQVNGRRLAMAVQLALAHRRGRVHLIGHSHGSAVVTHAAVSMTLPPAQVTLLDAPEDPISRLGGASDLIDLVLPRLRPGRERGTTFVDSYASVFGRPYHRRPGLSAVVDVLLGAPLVFTRDPVKAINAAHLYPVEWYARSVRAVSGADPVRPGERPGMRRRDKRPGRHSAPVGYGWSPLTGDDPVRLHSWYHAPLPQRPLVLRRHVGEPVAAASRRVFGRLEPAAGVAPRRPVPVRLDLTPGGPAAAIVVSAPGEQLIEFDLQLRDATGGERLEIDLDGVPAFEALAGHPVPRAGRYLMLSDGAPGEHLVTARLVGATGATRAEVLNLRLVAGPRAARGFTLSRSATTVFAAGVITGSAATVLATAGLGSLARWVWLVSRRRLGRLPGAPR